jgi:hypothetical protein
MMWARTFSHVGENFYRKMLTEANNLMGPADVCGFFRLGATERSGEHARLACRVRRLTEHIFAAGCCATTREPRTVSGETPEIAREDACAPRTRERHYQLSLTPHVRRSLGVGGSTINHQPSTINL